ncbi:hypothetical protein Tco_0467413 [Tanacetum coccineum]
MSKSFALSDNLQQHDTQPTLSIQPTLEPIIQPINVNAKENNIDQAADAQFEAYEFINPFAPLGTKASESSSRNVDTSNMHTVVTNIITFTSYSKLENKMRRMEEL